MSWGIVSDFVSKVRTYSTSWGQLWWVMMFVFRMMVVAVIGNQVYGDEQGAFKCDTLQPGCIQVCFNRFSPMGHMRFWSFQILFASIPAIFFYMYAGSQQSNVRKLEDAEQRRRLNDDLRIKAKAEYDVISAETSDNDIDLVLSKNSNNKETAAHLNVANSNLNISSKSPNHLKSPVLRSPKGSSSSLEKTGTVLSRKTDAILDHNRAVLEYQKETDIVKTLQKKVGNYKKKTAQDRLGRTIGEEPEIIWTTKIKLVYVIHCILKVMIELVFIVLYYGLQRAQTDNLFHDGPSFFGDFWNDGSVFGRTWFVPEKYVCDTSEHEDIDESINKHLIKKTTFSACHQQRQVACWVSRPYEKTILVKYRRKIINLKLVLIFLFISSISYKEHIINKSIS